MSDGGFKFDRGEMRRAMRAAVLARVHSRADAVAKILRDQAKARVVNEGDPGKPWPTLWANDDGRVRRTIRRSLRRHEVTTARETLRAEAEAKAQALARLKARIASGKVPAEKAPAKLRAAMNKARIAREQFVTGNPSYRRGGKALRDKGLLYQSLSPFLVRTQQGFDAGVASPHKYALYHQTGFKTKGPNYVPLSVRAGKKPPKMSPEKMGLVPGVDYVMIWGGVVVPARPIFRVTEANARDIKRTLAGRR